MTSYKKLLTISGLALVLTGCVISSDYNYAYEVANVPSQIKYAPIINVTYAQVTENIEDNIGVKVRWGGQIISTEKINENTTRLTVFSAPLTSEGRPSHLEQPENEGGHFIVDLINDSAMEHQFDGHSLTVFGDIVDQLVVTNGNIQKVIPVVYADELIDWEMVDHERVSFDDRRGNAFNILAYRNGHYNQYGYSTRYYSPSYYGGIGSSRFGIGSSRFGFGSSRLGFGSSRLGFGNSVFYGNSIYRGRY